MMFEAHREQNICPSDGFRDIAQSKGIDLTTYATMMFPSPSGENTLAIIAFLAIFVIHPIISRQTYNI